MCVVCFTGHRPASFPFGYNERAPRCLAIQKNLYSAIELLITQYGATHFISGMALGVDIWSAEAVLQLKAKYPAISLECAVPCRKQANRWTSRARARYQEMLSAADKVTVLSETYTPSCMQERNKYMVNSADFVVAVWNGKPSGTGNTVNYAKSLGKSVIRLDPAC